MIAFYMYYITGLSEEMLQHVKDASLSYCS